MNVLIFGGTGKTGTLVVERALGKDAEMRVKNVETARAEEAAKFRDLTLSTVFSEASGTPV